MQRASLVSALAGPLALALLHAGCSGGKHEAPLAGGSGSGSAATMATGPATLPTITPSGWTSDTPRLPLPHRELLVLREAGARPRRVVRYGGPLVPDVAMSELGLTARLTARAASDGPFGEPHALPAMHTGFGLTLARAPGTKLTVIGIRGMPGSTDPDAAGKPVPEAEQYLTRWRLLLADQRATAEVDDRGTLGEVRFPSDPTKARTLEAIDELTGHLLNLLVPLPEEPIGIGARWACVTILRQGAAAVKQTATYKLLKLSATAMTVEVTITRVGEDQQMPSALAPPGGALELIALFRQHTGTMELALASPLPRSATLTLEARVHMKITDRGTAAQQLSEDLGTLAVATAVATVAPSAAATSTTPP